MSTYTKRVDRYISTETVILRDGVEIAREENDDAYWYDTKSFKGITEEEAEDYL